ncbi:hypothetical protein ERJ75_001784100 [Trypanosoma vivax]|nr:hypothetical protein ERJ75_001784100 [Trypanosoma vivax]
MAFHFSLALLAAILLNGAVLGDDSTSSGALAGADGKRNAPSRGRDAVRKNEGRARNGDKLVVLDSARTTPSETARKSVSVVKRMSEQSSHSSRNEARNDHVGVGNELHDQAATGHKAQASAGDKHGMKLLRARRTDASRHSEGGLTSKNPKDSAEVLDHKKEFENMVSGIIAEEEVQPAYEQYGVGSSGSMYAKCPSEHGYTYPNCDYLPNPDVAPGGSSPVQSNASVSVSASSSTPSAASSPGSGSDQSSATGNGDEASTNDGKATEDGQEEQEKGNEKEKKQEENEEKQKEKEKMGNGKEREEKQLEQRSNENSDGQETNNSSEDIENENAPPSGNSAFLSGSYLSVLLVALLCLCACACLDHKLCEPPRCA